MSVNNLLHFLKNLKHGGKWYFIMVAVHDAVAQLSLSQRIILFLGITKRMGEFRTELAKDLVVENCRPSSLVTKFTNYRRREGD